ncbi:hypothetical protein [Devosia beringensis]|uniref:hypothetical protein n=1 Tax=Devosia beringensis TaxID=2657486 RepID=UPI00186BA4C7|nr:hypothetical protein [Devosia beringensis]
MTELVLYVLVLTAYAPGVALLATSKRVWRFPVVCFAFIGMIAFNAVGSIGVFSAEKIYWLAFDTQPVSSELAILLVSQAIIFYAICGTYVLLREPRPTNYRFEYNDGFLIALSMTAIFAIAALYYHQTGIFLIQSALDGSMDVDNSYSFRDKYVYGISNWPIYSLAFVFIPILLSNHGLIVFLSSSGKLKIVPLACLLVSFGASLSLGSKGGLLGFLLSLSVAYVTFLGMTGRTAYGILRSKVFWIFSVIAVATMVFGYIHATTELVGYTALAQRFIYRVFVAYPETIAAAISMYHDRGPLGIAVLPTMRGLLQHEQVNLSALLHEYEANTPGGVSVPFVGEAYLIGGRLGVCLALPMVFFTLIAIQEFASRLNMGLFAIGFAAIYSYLAIQLSLNGMFASLYNFMYPGTICVIGGLALGAGWIVRKAGEPGKVAKL